MTDLSNWPKHQHGYYTCSYASPMPTEFKESLPPGVAWMHLEAQETGLDSETKIEYHCPACGHTWFIEMPD